MKQLIQAVLSIGLVLGSINSVEACWMWPFCGGWGAGYAPAYAPAPAYGNYTAGYPAFGGFYSAGYAPASGCCAPSCCSPCGTYGGCGTCGSCGSGSCAGSTSSGTESLKPANDPNFRNGTQENEYDRKDPAPGGLDTPEKELPPFERPNRPKTNAPDPQDDFGTLPIGGGKSDEPFGLDPDGLDRINNKPPMPDAKDLPAVEPGEDGKTFLPGETTPPDGQTQLRHQKKSLAERSSGLNEVIVPKRLASRSLPSSDSRNPTSWAGKASDDKAQTVTPVRWISAPMPDGQIRL